MNKRSVLKVFIFLVYVALVVLFFAFAKERKSENSVCADSPCIRFCNEVRDSSFYNETSDGFEITNPISNVTQKYRIVDGKPCENVKLFESDQWTFSSVSRLVRARRVCHARWSVKTEKIIFFMCTDRRNSREWFVLLGEPILSWSERGSRKRVGVGAQLELDDLRRFFKALQNFLSHKQDFLSLNLKLSLIIQLLQAHSAQLWFSLKFSCFMFSSMNLKTFKENVSSASCFQLSSHAFWPD